MKNGFTQELTFGNHQDPISYKSRNMHNCTIDECLITIVHCLIYEVQKNDYENIVFLYTDNVSLNQDDQMSFESAFYQ